MNMWKYYNHAIIPTTPPHGMPDISSVENGDIWRKVKGKSFLARWTTDFDCGYETKWWYCIKDAPLELDKLKSKQRYEIKRGIANLDVEIISPLNYKQEIYEINKLCYDDYPKQYRPKTNDEKFNKQMEDWSKNAIVFAAFNNKTKEMFGYSVCFYREEYISLAIQKVPHQYQSYGTNAALIYYICEEFFNNPLYSIKYISDGARNIRHQTNFQDYLIKYFGFRKAYCKLHIIYRPSIRIILKILYPFRKFFSYFKSNKLIYELSCMLKQEEIARSFK